MSPRPTLALLPLGVALGCAAKQGDIDAQDTTAPENSLLTRSGPIHCAAPELRNSLGPMALYDAEDWTSQFVEPLDEEGKAGGWGLAVGDFNGDGRLDLYLPNRGPAELFMALPEGGWERASERLPSGSLASAIGAVTLDINLDGDLDLLVHGAHELGLLINDGLGNFSLGALDVDIPDAVAFSAAAADWDLDGDLDLFLPLIRPDMGGADGSELPPGLPSRLLENDGTGHFSDVSEQLPAETNTGYPFVAAWTDMDQDGWPDLYLANDHGVGVIGNRMWRNLAGEGFVDVSSDTATDVPADSMGLGIGDLNADGVPDYAFTGDDETILLESASDGTWYRSDAPRGLWPDEDPRRRIGWGIELADMDNDGDLDASVAFGHTSNLGPEDEGQLDQPDALYRMEGGRFVEVAEDWGVADLGWGRGFVVADLNGDGWLDLVKRELGAPPRMYLSRCGEASWLIVRLRDPGGATVIGAQVRVRGEGIDQVRWLTAGGTSISSSGPRELHFGLGEVDWVESVEVTWPDGEVDTYEGLDGRQQVEISRAW